MNLKYMPFILTALCGAVALLLSIVFPFTSKQGSRVSEPQAGHAITFAPSHTTQKADALPRPQTFTPASELPSPLEIAEHLELASPDEAIAYGDLLVADATRSQAALIDAMAKTMSEQSLGQIANILARIGTDESIVAVFTAAALEKDFARREAMISGLASGVTTPSAAALLATTVLVSEDPSLLAPIVETVSRLADETVLAEIMNLSAEEPTTPEQRIVLAQMIAGIRNPDLVVLLAGIEKSDGVSQNLRAAAGEAARALGAGMRTPYLQ